MKIDDSDEEISRERPDRYALQWVEGMHPDETDATVETVGDG